MKNFQKFLEEADIKGNVGIPGEGEKKPGDTPYLSDVEKRAKKRLGITPEDLPRMSPRGPVPSEKERRLGGRLMQLISTSQRLSGKNMTELSALVSDLIYNLYKDIIDRYEIELDIKLVKPGKIKDFMGESEDEDNDVPKVKKITDPEVIKEIQKRKIANLVIQGEAKNTKHLLHTEEIKNGFNEILGERDGKLLFDTLDELAKIMDQLDWIIPEKFRAEMMEQMPDGLAGATSVGWKTKEKEEEKEEEEEEYKEFTGEEEYEEDDYEEESTSNGDEKTPILRARGIDVSVLLHESVKGLFEILSLMGLPVVKDEDGSEDQQKTKELLQKIYSNTGLSDEPQDWKYGPEIAADIRDFVNINKNIDTYPNVREELWKVMIDRRTMPTDKFLELVRGILSKTQEARIQVDVLINQVITKIKNEKEYQEKLDQYERDMEEYNKKMEEYNKKMEEWEKKKSKDKSEDDADKLIRQSLYGKEEEVEKEEEIDYSTWSKSDIQDEIDAALDSGDFEKVKMLSNLPKFKNEGKIYLRELKMINERLNPHTK